jgi:hypothetical protein
VTDRVATTSIAGSKPPSLLPGPIDVGKEFGALDEQRRKAFWAKLASGEELMW